jgi:MFS superfamily sulfate permease-like transporter
MLYRFTHSMYYANAQLLAEEITYLTNNAEPPLRWFCIDASAIDDVDYSAAETLRSVYAILKEKKIRLVLHMYWITSRKKITTNSASC